MATLAAPDNESAHAMTGSLTSSPLPRLTPGPSPQSWRGVRSLPSPLGGEGSGKGPGEGEFVAPSAHFHVKISARALRPDRGGCRVVGEEPAFCTRRGASLCHRDSGSALCSAWGRRDTVVCEGVRRGSAADSVLPLPSRVGQCSGSDRLPAQESKSTTVRVLNGAPPNPALKRTRREAVPLSTGVVPVGCFVRTPVGP